MARSRRPSQPRKRSGTVDLPRMNGSRFESPTIDWKKTPNQVNFPSTADLVNLNVAQRFAVFKQFGLSPSWDTLRAEAGQYVTKLTTSPPGSVSWNAEIDRLLDQATKRGALGLARTAYRQFGILDSGADMSTQIFVRITEGDEHVCDPCDSLGGEEGTMAYHESIGLPGPASCLGGMYCRCQLIMVD